MASIVFIFEGVVIPWQENAMIRMSANTANLLEETAGWLTVGQQQSLCEQLVADNPDLSYVLIVDSKGRAIAHSDPQRVGMVFDDPGTLAAASEGKIVQQAYVRDQDNASSPYYGERIIDILYPLSDAGGRPSGAVNVGLSMSRVDTIKGQYRLLIALIGLVILASMLFLTYNFFSHIYKPIDMLVQATRKFRDDQTPSSMTTLGDDEFADLLSEFNGMSGKLSGLISDLSRRERELQEYVDHLLTFNAKLAPDGRIQIMNRATPRPAGMGSGDLIGLRLDEEACWAMPPEARKRLTEYLGKAARGEPVQYEETLPSAAGKAILEIGLRPVEGQAGGIDYIVANVTDITGRKQIEELLRQSEQKYRAIFENTVTGTVILDEDMTILLANSEFEKLSGFTREEMEGRLKIADLLPQEAREQATENHRQRIGERDFPNLTFEHRIVGRQGQKRDVIAKGSVLPGTRQAVISLLDITERKQAEDMVKSSLREKEVLLREIHHRVKNNLQIISSLLNLQSAAIGDRATALVYEESQNRIKSMALIHEKLYQSQDLSHVDFSDYIDSLAKYLFQSYVKDQGRILLDLQVEKVNLDIDAAIPCGLIINELVTNSLKHAFPGDRRGKLTVGLHVRSDNSVELTVRDDGVGLPPELDSRNSKTLGLQLVYALGSQLEGEVEIENRDGVAFRLTFANPGP